MTDQLTATELQDLDDANFAAFLAALDAEIEVQLDEEGGS